MCLLVAFVALLNCPADFGTKNRLDVDANAFPFTNLKTWEASRVAEKKNWKNFSHISNHCNNTGVFQPRNCSYTFTSLYGKCFRSTTRYPVAKAKVPISNLTTTT